MRVTVKKWGNSAAVRLPASVMQATQLEIDDVVEVREELLKGISNKNQHREIDSGPAVGREVW